MKKRFKRSLMPFFAIIWFWGTVALAVFFPVWTIIYIVWGWNYYMKVDPCKLYFEP